MDQLKTQFLAMMSHKLGTPLNTIAGLSESLLETAGPLTDQQQRDVSLVRSLAQYLLELTDDFLDVSKMRAGKITLILGEVDLRLLIESALDAVAPLIEDKPITLRAELDPDLPIVCADKRRVRQAVLNLLSNAAAFTDAGCICVAARKIEALNVDNGCMEPFVEVRVSDSGLVISEERLSQGLEAFSRPAEGFRAQGQPISESVAAGFGLPITKALINLHGGRLWVDGEPGKGVAFTFVLPIDQPDVKEDQVQSSKTSQVRRVEVVSYDTV
jgi:signal transduction histidine kinase